MSLGLNIIVGPEDAEILDRCLLSVQGDLFDEYVIVNAAPIETPDVKKVCDKYNINYHFFKWSDDFGKARNYCKSLTKSDYFLWLDSDDVLKPSEYKKLLDLKPQIPNWDILLLNYVYTHDDDDNPVLVLPRERIVKNCDHIKWHDPIHEYMNLDVPPHKIKRFPINVDHYRMRVHNPARNIEALKKVYESGTCSERIKFYYGKELADCGMWEKAVSVLEPYIKTGADFADNLTTACIRLARYYIDKGDNASAKTYALKGVRFNGIYAENYVILGSIFEQENDPDTAASYYKEALSKKLEGGMSQIIDYYGFIPAAKLALLYYNHKDYEEGLKYCNLALKHKPGNEHMLELLKIMNLEVERLSKGVVLKEDDLKKLNAYLINTNIQMSILKNNIDFCDIRLKRIKNVKSVWFIPSLDLTNPATRIRRYNVCKQMHDSEIITNYYGRTVHEIKSAMQDATVAIFTQFGKEDLEIIKHLKASGVKCVLDMCEAVFNFPYENDCLKEVDLITCCSTKLMELLNERGFMRTIVLKDPTELESALAIYEDRYPRPKAVYVGMGGNSWLINDWLKDTIESAGYDIVTITEWENATKKWQLDTWSIDMAECDVVLCPQRVDVQPAKSAVKATTAMALGMPVICSPLHAYKEFIISGENGFICDTKEEWLEALIKLKDKNLRKKIGEAGKASVGDYSLGSITQQWEDTLMSLVNDQLSFQEPEKSVEIKDRPIVDIIIANYNNVEYLKMCVSSILMNTLYPYHIIISDGGSDKETWDYLRTLKGITVLGDPNVRLSFSETCNAGIKASNTKYFVILNSDVIVSKCWLTSLVNKMESVNRLASCGVLSNCDRGWLFDAPNKPSYPMLLEKSGIDLHPAMKIDEIKPHVEELYSFMEESNKKFKDSFVQQEWVAAYATIFARCAINEVGLFDPLYKNGCEDLDLMVRLGRFGYITGQAIDSFVFHFGGVSRNAYQNENKESYDKEDTENHLKYRAKWNKKRVVIWTGPAWEPWNKEKVDEGMAGSETWAAYLSREFVKKGFRVTVYNDLLIEDKSKALFDPVFDDEAQKIGDVVYRDYRNLQSDVEYDVIDYFIASRSVDPLKLNLHSLRNYIMIHDIWLSADKSYDTMTWRVDKYGYLSEWHKEFIMKHHGIVSDKMFLTANGQDFDLYADVDLYQKKNQAVYSSSPDRGLYQLLKMLPAIRKEIPDFELVVAYGFFNWESMAKMRGDQESLNFIAEIKRLMEQPGVKYVDRVNKKTLAHYEKESKIWLFPSWFSETFCCLPGTQITTNESLINVESITKGITVLTHTGNLKPVTNTFVHNIDEDINIIKAKYLMDTLRITSKHSILALPKSSDSLHCVRLQHTLCTKRALKCSSKFNYKKGYCSNKYCWKLSEPYTPGWLLAESLKKGDYVLYPKNKRSILPGNFSDYSQDSLIDGNVVGVISSDSRKHLTKGHTIKKVIINSANKIKDFRITEDFLLFCGWYISEGCYDGKSTISFSLHKEEIDTADFLIEQGKKIGLNPWVCQAIDSYSMTVCMSSAILGRFFIDNFGDGAKCKKIPQWIKDLPTEMLKHVIAGILLGDGSFNRGTVNIECASKQLIVDLFDALLKFNCVSSTSKSLKHCMHRKKVEGTVVITRGKKTLNAYSLSCSVSQNIELFKFIGYDVREKRSTGQAALQDDNYAYLPIVSNTTERYVGPVYNFEVAEDNTYVANSITVHNCITAVSAGLSKNAILSTDYAGLQTTVGSAGILLPPDGLSRNGDYPTSYTARFVGEAVKMLSDEAYRLTWAEKAYDKMKTYTWGNVAEGWMKQFGL